MAVCGLAVTDIFSGPGVIVMLLAPATTNPDDSNPVF